MKNEYLSLLSASISDIKKELDYLNDNLEYNVDLTELNELIKVFKKDWKDIKG